MTDTDHIHVNPSIEVEKSTNGSTLRTSTNQPADDRNERKHIKSEQSNIEPAKAPQSFSQGKNTDTVENGDAENPESERARIERMGRERPTQFKSFIAELAFCYSVIASQFMSVSFVATTPWKATKMNPRNTLSLVSTFYYRP